MKTPSRFSYHFFPVGQGLFSAGVLRCKEIDRPSFLWVYDCGTLSSQRLLERNIPTLKSLAKGRNRIDILTISHFDHDHISGVCKLIKEFRVGTLLLPYMSLAERLLIAFEDRTLSPADPLMGFFLNPVAYLLALDGPGIQRILFVLASGNEGPPISQGGEGGQPLQPDLNSDDLDINFDEDKPDDRDEIESLFNAVEEAGARTRIQFLRRGSAITVRTYWEFVPYNDDPKEKIPRSFLIQVHEERLNLLRARSMRARNYALKRLKKIYDEHFGDSSLERNLISLFLYSGPIYSSWRVADLYSSFATNYSRICHLYHIVSKRLLRSQRTNESSIIYTGDGYLDTTARLYRILNYLGEDRIKSTCVFQVMHHGAESNWHKGVAVAIAPRYSIFSSDPERKLWGHPHALVLRDFWPYGAIQVDKNYGAYFKGILRA